VNLIQLPLPDIDDLRERELMSTETPVFRANELNVEGEARIYRTLRHFWHPVAYAQDLVGAPIGFTLCGRDIVVVRLEGDVVAFDDLCAHRGTKLSLGQVLDNCLLECRYHGWRYDKNGECVIVPQRPDLASRLKARVRKYLAEERLGMIWVALVDEPHFPLPDYPQWNEPEYHHVAVPSVDWACSAPRRVENYTDYSHFPILHDKTLGDRTQPEVPPHEVWREANRLENRQGAGSWIRVPVDTAAWGGKDLPPDPYIRFAGDWRVFMPLTCVLNLLFEDGNRYHLLFHPTPIGPKKIRNFTIASRNFGNPENKDKELGEFVTLVYDQDQPVVESQRPEELPEDLSEEIHLKGVDTFSVDYRRWLLALADELED
jgi:phenylpropionate dioxygenase-like ring-hydroxylating dioxygenase large terminal subunit